MNIKPLFRYRTKEGFLGVATYLGVLTLVTLLMIIVACSNSGMGHMNLVAIGMASAIFFLVWGIVAIREDLRLGLQFGLSRRTIFVSNLAAALVISLVAATAGELLLIISQTAAVGRGNLSFRDAYQLLFLPESQYLSFSQHLTSAFFNFITMWVCYGVGLVLSLLYFRLSKLGIILFSVIGGLVLLVGTPFLALQLAPWLEPFFQWLLSGLGNWSVVMALLTAALLTASFLLLRRAPAKPIK